MRGLLLIGAIGVVIAFLWTGWVMLERHAADSRLEREESANREQAEQLPPGYEGNSVRILDFYSSTGDVTAGKPATICYGVENAKSVRIVPPVENVYPALSRCFSVEPKRNTTYKLIAKGFDGREISQTISLKVK